MQLAIGQAMFALERGLFGVVLPFERAGAVALVVGVMAVGDRAPRVDRRFRVAGVAPTLVAGAAGVGTLFDAGESVGRSEALCSLVALVWIAAFGALVCRAVLRAPRTARS